MNEKVLLSDDCISREMAFAVIEEKQKELCPAGLWGRRFASDEDKYDAWQEILEELEDIPAADVEPVRHGRWVEPSWIYYGAKQYVCDQCKNDEYWRKRLLNYKENYCPNCGARMDRGKNENGV